MRIPINPQLCKVLDPKKFPALIEQHGYALAEPKFDGLRCILPLEMDLEEEDIFRRGDGIRNLLPYSRNGKPLYNMDHILEELSNFMDEQKDWRDVVLDGEVFTTDWNLSMGIVKSSKTRHADALKLRLHVWDAVRLDDWKLGGTQEVLEARRTYLRRLFARNTEGFRYIQLVQGVEVTTLEEARQAYLSFVQQGYEGAVIKFPLSTYQLGKRSPEWLKWKPYYDADLAIVDCIEGVGKRKGKVGALLLEGDIEIDGQEVHIKSECGVFRCNDLELERMWFMHQKGELVGLLAEIRFDSVTAEGCMRFPRFYRLREDRARQKVEGFVPSLLEGTPVIEV